jgi:putative transposase
MQGVITDEGIYINSLSYNGLMKFDPQKHHRRSIRLREYDYSHSGAYYVTIVTLKRECLLGEIANGEMQLNEFGEIVQKWWGEIPGHFPAVETGTFVVMPNHVHGIILITDRRGTVPVPENNFQDQHSDDMKRISGGETPPLRKPTLGQIVAYFKYQSTQEMNTLDGSGGITKFWQRNYYEHIIRNKREMDNIWRYIEANPSIWVEDDENPLNKP